MATSGSIGKAVVACNTWVNQEWSPLGRVLEALRDQNWFQSQLSGKSSRTRFWIRKLKGLRALAPVEPKMIPDEVLDKENEGFESMCADRVPQLRNC